MVQVKKEQGGALRNLAQQAKHLCTNKATSLVQSWLINSLVFLGPQGLKWVLNCKRLTLVQDIRQ